jgi:hypothetical protein
MWSSGQLQVHCQPLCGAIIGVRIRSLSWIGVSTLGLSQNRWFILIYHVRGHAWIEFHRNSIQLRVQSRISSNHIWGSVTTLHNLGGVLGRPWDTFFWALTISWWGLLAFVWSGPQFMNICLFIIQFNTSNACSNVLAKWLKILYANTCLSLNSAMMTSASTFSE